MVSTTELLTLALSLGLIAAGGYLMNMFFGLFGAGLFVVFMVLVLGGVFALTGGTGGGDGGSTASHARASKGARKQE